MKRLKSVLAGVDFSECSKSALTQAARIARAADGSLHVVHVIESLVVTEVAEATNASAEDVRREATANARAHLDAWVAGIGPSPKVELHVRCGSTIDELLKTVRETAPDLLVLGVHGIAGGGEGAGTLATSAVRKAPCRVLLVNEAHTDPYSIVVACVDFSDSTPAVINQAVRVAREDGSRLHLLHVYSGPWHQLHYRAPTPELSPEFQRGYLKTLQMRLENCLREAEDTAGIEVKYGLVDHRSYGRGIVQYAREKDADLVVLGTHGRTKLRYMLMGSTAERVLRELSCSVLAIKPQGFGVSVEETA
jgi:nucleotide-binding universal stress UspA family protein